MNRSVVGGVAAAVLAIAAFVMARHFRPVPHATTTTTTTTSKPSSSMDGDDADPSDALLADLEQQETALRASTDWATFPSSDRTLGPDPVDIAALDDSHFVAALRGDNAIVVVDASGHEVDRAAGPRAARAVSVGATELGLTTVAAVGELDARLLVVNVDARTTKLAAGAFIAVDGVAGMRGVAVGKGRFYVVDLDGNLLTLDVHGKRIGKPIVVGAYAVGVKLAGDVVVAMSALGHRILAVAVDKNGDPMVATTRAMVNDGPFWGFDAVTDANGVTTVVAGHVEDDALDRTGGSFGYIDSFVSVWRFNAHDFHDSVAAYTVMPVLSVNASQHGVVVPKAIALVDEQTALVVGAGSGAAFELDLHTSGIEEVKALPGITAVAVAGNHVVGADALLDAFVSLEATPQVVAVPPLATSSPRSSESKLGEALAFTTIMAPRQKSDGALSRFTCESCHFEGGGDGRVHDTGRLEDGVAAGALARHITATTKPLFGLFNNKPLFTRALDKDLSQMVHAEFRVANANSSLDPWFALTPADAPWLSYLGVAGTQSPIDLRRALVAFLHDYTPRTNANVVARTSSSSSSSSSAAARFSDDEKRGADVFRDRCASCHKARLIGDDARTAQPFDAWERLVLTDNGPLVWAGDGDRRMKTGIEPYVHEEGARASSLRRIARKTPYFTNGSAATLDDVVARFRFSADDGATPTFLHSSNRADLRALSVDEQHALVAFLRLL